MLKCWSVGIRWQFITPRFRHSRTSWSHRPGAATCCPGPDRRRLHGGVARAEHGGEPGRLFFAPAPLAGLLKMPVVAHHFQCSFAVNLLLRSPQRRVHWLALLKLNFGQNSLTSSPDTAGHLGPSWPALPLGQTAKSILPQGVVNGKMGRKMAAWPDGSLKPACLCLRLGRMVCHAFAQAASNFDRGANCRVERQALDHAA